MKEASQPAEHVGIKYGLNPNFYNTWGKNKKNCLLEERRTFNEHDEIVIHKWHTI
jgi:hypothetical protein